MNTFVIKSKLKFNGQCIGMSPDSLYVYIYRSHKVFKDANPCVDLEDFTVLEDPTEKDFDFKKYNVCPYCAGLKAFYFVSCDKPMNGDVLYDEDGFALFDEKVCTYCVCNDIVNNNEEKYIDGEFAGTYIGYLEHEFNMLKRDSKDAIDDLRLKLLNLQCYIKSVSTCKICKGNQETMYEHERCEECGLPGIRTFIIGG